MSVILRCRAGRVNWLRPARSRHDLVDHVAVDVGQAEVAAAGAKRQPLVIEAEEVQDRRVQIVHVQTFSTACMPSSSVAP